MRDRKQDARADLLSCSPSSSPLAAPDVGVDSDIAHLYFRQLISGLVRPVSHGCVRRRAGPCTA